MFTHMHMHYVEFGMISEKYCECESHIEASYKNIVRNTFFLENKDITVTSGEWAFDR